MPEPNLLAGGHAEADAPVAPVVLHQDIPEGDAAQERAGCAVVEHAQAVRAGLARVHEQVVQRPRLQPHILRHGSLQARTTPTLPLRPGHCSHHFPHHAWVFFLHR